MTSSDLFGTLKGAAAKVLGRSPRALAAASRLLYSIDRRFRTLSPATPDAVHAAWIAAKKLQSSAIGDYYEFGVFRGYTLWRAQQSAKQLGIRDPRFWGFDSFQGLPAVTGTDAEDGIFFEGQFACSREEVLSQLSARGADMNRITLIKGYFSESLTPRTRQIHAFRPAGVVLIDCDLYSSTVEVLAWLADLLQENSILLFDDWKSFGQRPDRGQPLAFGEFLKRKQWRAESFLEFGRNGRAFILHRTQ